MQNGLSRNSVHEFLLKEMLTKYKFQSKRKKVNKSSKCPDKNNFVLTWVIRANNVFGLILPRKMSYNPMHIETSSMLNIYFRN